MSDLPIPSSLRSLTAAELWDLTAEDLTLRQQKEVSRIKLWLQRKKFRLARLLSGRENLWSAWTAEEVSELERSAIAHFRSNLVLQHVLRICGKLLLRAAELLGCDLPLPRIPVCPRRPRNPFHQDLVGAKRLVEKWRAVLDEWVEKSKGEDHTHFPAVVLSSVLYGGLLHASTLVAFFRTVAEAQNPLGFVNGQLQINFLLPKNGQADMEKRCWTLDPLTASLLARLPANAIEQLLQSKAATEGCTSPVISPERAKRLIWKQLASALRESILLDRKDRPVRLNQFIGTVALAYSTELPGILLAYAARRVVSHSLKPHVSLRLAGVGSNNEGRTDPFALPSQMAYQLKAPRNSRRRSVPEAGSDIEPPWLRALRQALRAPNKERARALVQELQLNGFAYSPAGQRMIEFAGFLLAGATGISSSALSTAQVYVPSVAVRFGCLLDGQDPRTMSIATLEVLYAQVLETTDLSRSPGVRKAVCRHLRRFHEFLMTQYSVGALQDRDLLGTRGGLVPVDANILSLEEFHQFLRQMDHLRVHPKLKRAAKLISILGYRCGLRQMEVLMLQLSDLHLRGPGTLLVRLSEFRDLKTPAAIRNLPLDILLTEEELALLRDWKQERVAQRNEGEPPFVFSVPELSPGVLSERLIFPLIHRAMREVTGDQSVRFHHFRHSFATWVLARLLVADLPQTPTLHSHLPATTEWLKTARQFTTRLYGHEHLTRKHGYAVARLLGHSSPQTSLEHYVHCLDWILPAYFAQTPSLAPSERQLVLASGRSSSTAYSWLQRGGPPYLVQQLFAGHISEATPTVTTSRFDPNTSTVESVASRIQAAWDFLYLFETTGTPMEQLQEDFPFEAAELEGMLSRARALREMRSGRRRGPRHRMVVWTSNRARLNQQPWTQRRLCCPMKPHIRADSDVVTSLAPRLSSLLEKEPNWAQKVVANYVESIWLERNLQIFEHPEAPEEVQDYLRFLHGLGIRQDQTRFVSFDQGQRSPWRALWRKSLNLAPRHTIEVRQHPDKQHLASAKWIGIEPHLGVDRINSPAANQSGSYGFRFLLVMTDILLHGQQATARASVLDIPSSPAAQSVPPE